MGRFYIEENGTVKPYSEKIEDDFRHSVEFILKQTSYTEQDLMRKDFLTFLKILRESESRESDAVKRMESSNNQ